MLIRDLAFLSSPDLEGRKTGSAGNRTAGDYIAKRFDSLGLEWTGDSRRQPFNLKNGTGATNILGLLKGSTWPDTCYVISAHYDHLGKRGQIIFAGADDNASGSAALLAMAAYFRQHPPKHSLIFTAFDAEETGLVGARYFVAHPPVGREKILLNINMDMVSRNDRHEIYVCGIRHYPFLGKYIDSILPKTTVKLLRGHDDPSKGAQDDWTNQSDQGAFHRQKIPFLYFGVEDHQDYHQPGDTFDKIDKSFYFQVCNVITETIALLDRQEKL